jgi:hypothetical protein
MNHDQSPSLNGLLLEWPSRPVKREDILRSRDLEFHSTLHGSRWEQFVYSAAIAFRGEDLLGKKPPFRYRVVVRRSGARLLVLSDARRIVEHLVDTSLNDLFPPYLRRVSIGVDALVKAMVKKPTIYSLTFVHARVPAFGASLRSVSFYGDDLTEASLLRENVALMNFFTCGLRPAAGGQELVRIGGDGSISFYLVKSTVLQEIENALAFLKQQGYLSSEVLGGESAP